MFQLTYHIIRNISILICIQRLSTLIIFVITLNNIFISTVNTLRLPVQEKVGQYRLTKHYLIHAFVIITYVIKYIFFRPTEIENKVQMRQKSLNYTCAYLMLCMIILGQFYRTIYSKYNKNSCLILSSKIISSKCNFTKKYPY